MMPGTVCAGVIIECDIRRVWAGSAQARVGSSGPRPPGRWGSRIDASFEAVFENAHDGVRGVLRSGEAPTTATLAGRRKLSKWMLTDHDEETFHLISCHKEGRNAIPQVVWSRKNGRHEVR